MSLDLRTRISILSQHGVFDPFQIAAILGAEIAVVEAVKSDIHYVPDPLLGEGPPGATGPAGPAGAAGAAGAPGAAGAAGATGPAGAVGVYGMQSGVLKSTDAALSGISINTGTGALGFTLTAAAPTIVVSSGGVPTAVSLPGGGRTITPALPAASNYAVAGLEVDTAGAVTLVKGVDTLTQLNTAALIAANSPAVSSGKERLYDFAVWNNGGVYNFGDHTTVATQGVNWVDRRGRASGARYSARQLSTAYASSAGTWTAIDTGKFTVRMELSGVPVRIRMYGIVHMTGGGAPELVIAPSLDGDIAVGASAGTPAATNPDRQSACTTTTYTTGTIYDWEWLNPAAGSHLISMLFANGGAGGTVNLGDPGTQFPTGLVIEEFRATASNGVT